MPQPCSTSIAVLLLERLDHGGRRRGAADHHPLEGGQACAGLTHMVEQAEPDRRHARGEGHALALELLVEARSVQARPGHHHARADQRAGIGQAPGVDVEHGHHRQHGIPAGQPHDVGHHDRERVQHRRAVVKERALGIAGGAGRVAKAARRGLVELRPGKLPRQIRDQALVIHQTREPARGHVAGIAQYHYALEGGQLGRQLLQQRQEHGVGEQVAILGMVHDVGDLVREQPRIDRVTDGAAAGDGVVQLEVPVVVPGEGGDAFAWPHAKPVLERPGQLLGAPGEGGIGRAVRGRIRRAGHHLDRAVARRRVVQYRRDQKRPIHHQAAQHRHPDLPARLHVVAGVRRRFPIRSPPPCSYAQSRTLPCVVR